ncbi:MAG: pentose kinase, partial [Nitrospira sp.]|nr:pentose kinase [Nitrospira sp.]
NDKRTSGLAAAFDRTHRPETYLGETGNPPTPAWPAFKLQWLRDNDAAAWRKAEMVLMPKDFVNFRLTGIAATDWTEASCTFLMNPSRRSWSRAMIEKLGLDAAKMPPIRSPGDILGPVTPAAARETGLAEGTPVLVGGSDFPMALLGSGACRPGLASEVMGSSNIITSIMDRPLLRADISNVATIEGHWGAFALLDSGGDAMRWARRAFHEKKIDYEEIVARAAEAPAGAGMLFFLPYLVGERFGQHRNSRAQFFGLTAGHGLAHLHRAVMEGVAFAVAQQIRIMEAASGNTVERVIASGGGAKTALWLRIKASVYGIPIIVPREAECGITGCAALAATATGRFARLDEAIAALVGFENEVMPDPEWQAIYQKMLPVFEKLYRNAQQFYDDLDRLSD